MPKLNNEVVVRVSDTVGQVLDPAGKATPSVQKFHAKCVVGGNRLDFVVHAVAAIAEVCSFPSTKF